MQKKDWQLICDQVATETDPRRLCQLIDQLIKSLEARRHDLAAKSQISSDG